MSLTEAKKKDLEDKAFDKLFTKHKSKYERMAKEANDYAKKNVTAGRKPRPDDVYPFLYSVIVLDEHFRKHQEDNRARGKRFKIWFTEYVIDELSGGN